MKLKIKIKKVNKNVQLPEVIYKGEWIDLRAAETVNLEAPQAGTLKTHKIDGKTVSHRDVTFDNKLVSLGVAMELPKGFEAHILPRSGTYNNFGVILANSQGIIDNSYKSDNDIWKANLISFRDTEIKEGDRICQFRIQLSQKATLWQKLKWLLSSSIEFEEVKLLNNKTRGGFGSTGIK